MERFFRITLAHSRAVVALFLIVMLICACFIPFVRTNYNMVDYLPDDAQSTKAVQIMSDEFGFVPAGQIDGIWYKIIRIKKNDLVYELMWHEDLGNSIYSLTQNNYENDLLESRMNKVVEILNAKI